MFVLSEINEELINTYKIFEKRPITADDEDYNCFSYAIGIGTWINPIDFEVEDVEDLIEEVGLSNERELRIFREDYDEWVYNNRYVQVLIARRLIKYIKNLRRINSFDELKEDEYGISLAFGFYDYHFIRYEDGIYSHKMGAQPIQIINNEREGFGDRYDSKIIRFAMKKGDINFKVN